MLIFYTQFTADSVAILLNTTTLATTFEEGQTITICGEVDLAGSIRNITASFPLYLFFPDIVGSEPGKLSFS